MKLVIAEKPSMARDIARAMANIASDMTRLPIHAGEWCFAAAAGHLLGPAEPSDVDAKYGTPWTLDVLPVRIEPWPVSVKEGKEELLNTLGRLLKAADEVYHCGDPDDEGQLLVDEILDYFCYRGPVKRVYINDSIARNIRQAFEAAVDNDACRPAGRAAFARRIGDLAFGANESRLATIKCNASQVLSVGRVQTPTLGLIVARDKAIAGHTKQKYYEAVAHVDVDGDRFSFKFRPGGEMLAGEKRVLSRAALEATLSGMEGRRIQFDTTESVELKHPPLPYNLAILGADMNRRHGYSLDRTQQITQVLKDRYKAITYNRSTCQYLKEAHYQEAPRVLGVAMGNIRAFWPIDFGIKSKAFNDGNVDVHHGIIPQETAFDAASLAEPERNVYTAVVERYAMQFLPPEKSDVSASTFSHAEGSFACRLNRVVDPGWRGVFSGREFDEAEDKIGTKRKQGDSWLTQGRHTGVIESIRIVEKETAPPKPYTQATLVMDMVSISKYVSDPEIKRILIQKDADKKGEHGSIGTAATRADIVRRIIEAGYVEEDKGKLHASQLGRSLFELLPNEIKSVDTTARWWLMQQEVAAGAASPYCIVDSVAEVFDRHKDTAYEGVDLGGRPKRGVIAKCPRCGRSVVDLGPRSRAFECESNLGAKGGDGHYVTAPDACGFKLWKTVAGKVLTENQARELITKGKTTHTVGGLKRADGVPFKNAPRLVLDFATMNVGFEYPQKKGKNQGPPKNSRRKSAGRGRL